MGEKCTHFYKKGNEIQCYEEQRAIRRDYQQRHVHVDAEVRAENSVFLACC